MKANTKNKKLATLLANKLLAIGADDCNRIQFMSGHYPADKPNGGLCEDALIDFFERFFDAQT